MYVGFRGKTILWVSSTPPTRSECTVLKLGTDLSQIPEDKLMKEYEVVSGCVLKKNAPKDEKTLKAAFVGVYKAPCGIATYSEWLWKEMGPQFKDFHIFAEAAVDAPQEPKVTRCWERGKPLMGLVRALREYQPDVIYIQHEFGIFPNARYWLSLISNLHFAKVIVTLHSVYEHKDKTICEAAIPNVVVHTEIAANCLKQTKKVSGQISIIPHGSFPQQFEGRYWNMYRSEHTLVQFGFGFRYKGWEQALDTVAALKEEYPDVFFTGIFSESLQSKVEHDQYFAELMERVQKRGLEEHVAFVRGFQSDETLQSYLRTNRVALFPYIPNGEHTVFGCSGAARIAMTNGIPTVATNVPLFDDLEGVCPRPKTVEGIVAAVRELFDPEKAKQQVERQKKFLEETSWSNVAKRYVALSR